MAHKILITVLICFTALRIDLPSCSAPSASDEAAFSTRHNWDEHEYPTDESEFPDADDLEVVEAESKPVGDTYCGVALPTCMTLGSTHLRQGNSVLQFSLGSFDILDRLRL